MSESSHLQLGNVSTRRDRYYSGLKIWLDRHGCRRFKTVNGWLMATCPFHSEKNPSFGVIVDARGYGKYNCFACGETGTIKGLIKKLEGAWTPLELIIPQLVEGTPVQDYREYKKKHIQELKYLTEDALNQYNYLAPYWEKRGIRPDTAAFFKLGYDPESWSITIPVRKLRSKELIGVCFRYVDNEPGFPEEIKKKLQTKQIQKYYYLPGSQPLLSLCGLETIQSFVEPVYLFEGAIDAINYYQLTNSQSLARWGTSLSPQQREFLYQFPEVIVVGDNDKHGIGQMKARSLYSQLIKNVKTRIVTIDGGEKDVSEVILGGATEVKFKPIPLS